MPQKDAQHEHEIAAIIGKLLGHYRQRDEAPVDGVLAGDWLDAFTEFDVKIVDTAARDWLWSQKWKPTIAELRALCREGQDNAKWRAERALPEPDATPAQISDAAESAIAIAINRLRMARGVAYRAGELAAWNGADGDRLRQLCEVLDRMREGWATPYEVAAAVSVAQATKQQSHDDDVRHGRVLADTWAREQGYPDFDTAYREGRRYSEVTTWVMAQAKPNRIPLEPGEAAMSAAEKERLRRDSFMDAAE